MKTLKIFTKEAKQKSQDQKLDIMKQGIELMKDDELEGGTILQCFSHQKLYSIHSGNLKLKAVIWMSNIDF